MAFLIPLALPFIEEGIQSIFNFANNSPQQSMSNDSESYDDSDYYGDDSDYSMEGY